MTTDLKPWHRQPGETPKSFHAFMLYRDMLPKERSMERVAEKLGKVPGYRLLLEKWSSRYHWVARARANDSYLAEVRHEAMENAIREMAERQAQEGMWLQAKGIEWLKSLGVDDIKARDAIQAIDIGAKVERTARGEPTEIIKGDVTVRAKPMSDYTDEELDEIIAKKQLPSGIEEEQYVDHNP